MSKTHPKILLAEDDLLLAETLNDYLAQQGFRVALSADGQEALETAAAAPFDALLTDLRMPRVDGLALVRTLRENRPALPVVVMTAYAPDDWQSQLQRDGEGPLLLLRKPLRLADLLQALRNVLGSTAGCVSPATP